MDDSLSIKINTINKSVKDGDMEMTDSIGINMINLENFRFNFKGGDTGIAELFEIKKWIDDIGKSIAYANTVFLDYHVDSHNSWSKTSDEDDVFRIYINLTFFMNLNKDCESYSYKGNYDLSSILIDEFEGLGNSIFEFENHSFFDISCFETKDKEVFEKFTSYVQEKYINPEIERLMVQFNVEEIIFLENKLKFKFKENV